MTRTLALGVSLTTGRRRRSTIVLVIETMVFGHEGTALAATLYRPDDERGPVRAVVAASGFGGVKEMGLPALADRLAAAGIATLLFDYAGFGASAGEPRQHVDPWSQVAQYRSALDHLGHLRGIDPERLGVVGPSLGGGHAMHLAATDGRVRAAVAVVPFVTLDSSDAPAGLVEAVMADADARRRGEPGAVIPLVGRPGETAVLTADGAWEWVISQLGEDTAIANEVTLASLAEISAYRPLDGVERIGAPLRVIVGAHDTVNPSSLTLDALAPFDGVDVVELPATHFSVFDEHGEATLAAGVDWFERHL